MHKPTNKLLVGVPTVEEHGEPGLLRQVELLLKVPARETKEVQKERRVKKKQNNQISIVSNFGKFWPILTWVEFLLDKIPTDRNL